MTKIWIAFVVSILILSLAFTEFHMTVTTAKQEINLIEKAEHSAKNNSEKTEKLCGDIKKLWDDKKHRLEIFLPHSDIDQIDISVENLVRYCEQKDFKKVYTECGVLKNHMSSLNDSEEVNFHNLF